MSVSLSTLLPALLTPSNSQSGGVFRHGLNYVQALGADELINQQAEGSSQEKKDKSTQDKSTLRKSGEKLFELVAPQLYTTAKLTEFNPIQLLLALGVGQKRYEGIRMAQGVDSEASLLKKTAKGAVGFFFPDEASTARTFLLGAQKLMSPSPSLDVSA